MFRSYLRIAFRNLVKSKSYSLLNIFGLAIGIACAGLIFLWVEDERSYDEMYSRKDQIYHLRTNQIYDGMIRTFNTSPGPMAPVLKSEIPGIIAASRVQSGNSLFNLGDKSLYSRGSYIDNDFLSMMDIHFLEGNARTAFSQLHSVILSQKLAEQFFGKNKSAIGKFLKVDNKEEYLVTGVMKDVPVNATMKYEWLAPFEIVFKERAWLNDWGNNATNTYIELAKDANVFKIGGLLHNFYQKRDPDETRRLVMLSMNDWRLRDKFENGKQVGGRIQFISMFSIIAWIVLLIACVNFMNLATARSEKRMREVGVRKVLGAERKGIIIQFLGEAMMISIISVCIGLLLISLSLPAFNLLVEKQLEMNILTPSHLIAAMAIAIVCGLVSGSYPALYLSSFNPLHIFKGLRLKNSGPVFIRKALVVLQFTISIVLIISAIIIYQQIHHVMSRDLGYDRSGLVSIDVRGEVMSHYGAIRQEMLNSGVVENLGLNSFNTVSVGNNTSVPTWKGKDPSKDILISSRWVDDGLIPTLRLKMAEGRNFYDNGADSAGIVITESLAKMMGEGSAIGKIIQFPGETPTDPSFDWTVVGVVKDFVYGDMYGTSDPVIFYYGSHNARYVYVRTKENVAMADALQKIGAIMTKNNPAYPFDYSFVDDQFEARFKSEMLIGKLSRVFAILAIIISCLGLFGLAAYTAERRTREIGIRKILGASVPGITRLLSKDFLILVLISALIAFPVAWLAMSNWLQGYAYRIDINWVVFVVAAVFAFLIAMITISFQAIRAAMANPVKSIRTE